jgi:hypothetical protein
MIRETSSVSKISETHAYRVLTLEGDNWHSLRQLSTPLVDLI